MKTKLLTLSGFVAAILLGIIIATALPLRAQTTGASSSIAPGPGGMWVLHQGQVIICRQPLVQTRQSVGRGSLPPTPVCGAPTRLP